MAKNLEGGRAVRVQKTRHRSERRESTGAVNGVGGMRVSYLSAAYYALLLRFPAAFRLEPLRTIGIVGLVQTIEHGEHE